MRKFNKTIGILTILMLVMTILPLSVFAKGTYTVSVSKTSLTVGGTASITVTAKSAAGKFTVTSSNPSVATVNESSMWIDGSHKDASSKITVTAKAAGTSTITITPTNVSDNEYNLLTSPKSITITVKNKTTTDTGKTDDTDKTDKTDKTESNKQETVKKSSDATLKSLTTKTGKINFSKHITNYTVEVDKTVTTLGLEATANNAKAKIQIAGDQDFKTGNNIVKVVVTAEDGTKKEYIITVIKSATGKAPLVNLEVEGYKITPEFQPDNYTYSVEVVDKTAVDIKYELYYKDASVVITGNNNLKLGINPVRVVVTEKDGTVTSYNINVKVGSSVENTASIEEKDLNIWIIVLFAFVIVMESMYIVYISKKGKKVRSEK